MSIRTWTVMTDYRKPSERISRYLCISDVELKADTTSPNYVDNVLKHAGVTTEYLVDSVSETCEVQRGLRKNNKNLFTFEILDLKGEIPPETFHKVKDVVLRNILGRTCIGYYHFIGYLDT